MKYFKLFLVVAVVSSSALAQEGIRITHLPYIQGLTDSSVNIVWTTNKPSTGWVELAPDDSTHFYLKERPKYFNSKYGFKMVGMVHSVELRNLKPNTVYRYRVYSQEVLKHEGVQVEYGRVAATGVYRQQPLRFKTTGGVSNISFAVINDIHGRNEVMNKLLGPGRPSEDRLCGV